MEPNKPYKKFRAGNISATIWQNERIAIINGRSTKYINYSVTLERGYKDKDGNWKNTHSLDVSDIPKANALLAKVYTELIGIQEVDAQPTPTTQGATAEEIKEITSTG